MVRITLCFALVTALAAPAAAQTGRIYGAVTDPSGAALPAVEVRAAMRDNTGESTRSVMTDRQGRYELNALVPGTWVVTTSLPGFETSTARRTVQNGDALEWSPTLQLGMIQETISVTTDPPQGPLRVETGRRELSEAPRQPTNTDAIRIGGSIKPPRKVVHVNPVYPPDAAAQGVAGVVVLTAMIGTDGLIRDVKTSRSPSDSLTLAATSALMGWEFSPTLLNGVPVDARIMATFNFQSQAR